MRAICVSLLLALPAVAADDDDVAAKTPSVKRTAGGDAKKEYFLVGDPKAAAPKAGFGLVVVLPGGDGSADFNPFVKAIQTYALGKEYLVAQPVAVKWSDDQEIVWPKKVDELAAAKFTTEEFIDAVIDDASKAASIDPKRVFTVSWSSSGPAAYAASLTSTKVRGSFVAMSVFNPKYLPPLAAAKGHAYYLYHSPDDRVCPYRMAEAAEKELAAAGAKVTLAAYGGGHGWRGPVHDAIKTGVAWLEKNRAK